MSGLAALLAAELGIDASRWQASAVADLEAALAEHLAGARTAWPGLDVSPERALAYLAARLEVESGAGPEDVGAAADQLAVSDLYLCCGCAAGDPAALAAFERELGPEIERATRRLDSSGDLGDEIRQVLRDKLFVAEPGAAPGIERYLGRGPLGRWIWVVATREALMWRRRRRREIPLSAEHLGIAGADLELEYLKREYRSEFRRAFAEAMDTLPSKQRNLLHYHFVRRLSIDQIGALYRVHRVTAFRWLRRARGDLVAATRRCLAARLEVGPAELDSILRLVQSRLEVSVERILGSASE